MPSEQLSVSSRPSTHNKRQRRRRGGTNLANIVSLEEEEDHAHTTAAFIYEHYRSFHHSRSLDIILELDESDDTHHYSSSLLSSPRYSKKGMKRTQTFSCLAALDAEEDENRPPIPSNNRSSGANKSIKAAATTAEVH